ncbi:MAG: DUF190 domain-containing protein [Bacteroidales bacterium]|nr:DUF190 domain-containing protein [Bacteroidales bacterium]
MNTEHSILKLYASTTDKIGPRLLYEHIVHKAKDFGISGVTVYRGVMGYGQSSKISTSRFWELTEKLPVMVELIDKTMKLEAFYTHIESELENMPKGCLVLMVPVTVKLHKLGKKD